MQSLMKTVGNIYAGSPSKVHIQHMDEICRTINPHIAAGNECWTWYQKAIQYCRFLGATKMGSTKVALMDSIHEFLKKFLKPPSKGLVVQKSKSLVNTLSVGDCYRILEVTADKYELIAPQMDELEAENYFYGKFVNSLLLVMVFLLAVVCFEDVRLSVFLFFDLILKFLNWIFALFEGTQRAAICMGMWRSRYRQWFYSAGRRKNQLPFGMKKVVDFCKWINLYFKGNPDALMNETENDEIGKILNENEKETANDLQMELMQAQCRNESNSEQEMRFVHSVTFKLSQNRKIKRSVKANQKIKKPPQIKSNARSYHDPIYANSKDSGLQSPLFKKVKSVCNSFNNSRIQKKAANRLTAGNEPMRTETQSSYNSSLTVEETLILRNFSIPFPEILSEEKKQEYLRKIKKQKYEQFVKNIIHKENDKELRKSRKKETARRSKRTRNQTEYSGEYAFKDREYKRKQSPHDSESSSSDIDVKKREQTKKSPMRYYKKKQSTHHYHRSSKEQSDSDQPNEGKHTNVLLKAEKISCSDSESECVPSEKSVREICHEEIPAPCNVTSEFVQPVQIKNTSVGILATGPTQVAKSASTDMVKQEVSSKYVESVPSTGKALGNSATYTVIREPLVKQQHILKDSQECKKAQVPNTHLYKEHPASVPDLVAQKEVTNQAQQSCRNIDLPARSSATFTLSNPTIADATKSVEGNGVECIEQQFHERSHRGFQAKVLDMVSKFMPSFNQKTETETPKQTQQASTCINLPTPSSATFKLSNDAAIAVCNKSFKENTADSIEEQYYKRFHKSSQMTNEAEVLNTDFGTERVLPSLVQDMERQISTIKQESRANIDLDARTSATFTVSREGSSGERIEPSNIIPCWVTPHASTGQHFSTNNNYEEPTGMSSLRSAETAQFAEPSSAHYSQPSLSNNKLLYTSDSFKVAKQISHRQIIPSFLSTRQPTYRLPCMEPHTQKTLLKQPEVVSIVQEPTSYSLNSEVNGPTTKKLYTNTRRPQVSSSTDIFIHNSQARAKQDTRSITFLDQDTNPKGTSAAKKIISKSTAQVAAKTAKAKKPTPIANRVWNYGACGSAASAAKDCNKSTRKH